LSIYLNLEVNFTPMSEKFAIIGLGYVGLPVAMAFAEKSDTLGFDIDPRKVEELRAGRDRTGQHNRQELESSRLRVTTDPAQLRDRTFFIVTVPTPIDDHKRPDLRSLLSASEFVGRVLSRGAVVVYESTVYPGVTEEVCLPVLEQYSGLRAGVDFNVGYSPERINPGDREHTFRKIKKIVSGDTPATLARIARAYSLVVEAGLHEAESIRVAEAAKVIENTQRDLNIALMNELAVIFDRLGISTRDVLRAAGTKWNFLPFTPGLVGGHCIGVDPYYLTSKAEQVGYHPQVILAGRRINDGMGAFIAQKTIKLLVQQGLPVKGARVGVLGLTFKENVPDLRNSRVPDIISELRSFGCDVQVHEPCGDPADARHEYGLNPVPLTQLRDLDALLLAVAHDEYRNAGATALARLLKPTGVVVDIKACFSRADFPPSLTYWRL
jgi:UDP-N-acetyl-D-galactosamine dehydrogenase